MIKQNSFFFFFFLDQAPEKINDREEVHQELVTQNKVFYKFTGTGDCYTVQEEGTTAIKRTVIFYLYDAIISS